MRIPRDAVKSGDEYRFPCPKCNHKNFYWNIKKNVGHCFRASCQYSPKEEESPLPSGGGDFFSPEKEVKVEFQKDSVYIRRDKKALEALISRGISYDVAIKYGVRSWRNYIQVPVFMQGKLVNIVQRKINRKASGKEIFSSVPHEERYLYLKGVKTSKYLFNFSNYKYPATNLTLVENTFNAMWLSTSTNFGSHLSRDQIGLIKNSLVRRVLILWDARAPTLAAVNALRKAGVKCESFFLRKGQPDDYPQETILNIIRFAHRNIRNDSFSDWIREQPLSLRYRIG